MTNYELNKSSKAIAKNWQIGKNMFSLQHQRRVGRVVEGARLESV